MTLYSTCNSPSAVRNAVVDAIRAIHTAGITLSDKAIALTILAEIATIMKDDSQVMQRTWQKYTHNWGE